MCAAVQTYACRARQGQTHEALSTLLWVACTALGCAFPDTAMIWIAECDSADMPNIQLSMDLPKALLTCWPQSSVLSVVFVSPGPAGNLIRSCRSFCSEHRSETCLWVSDVAHSAVIPYDMEAYRRLCHPSACSQCSFSISNKFLVASPRLVFLDDWYVSQTEIFIVNTNLLNKST